MVAPQSVMEALQQVKDPELGIDIVNLGLVYHVETVPETGTVLVEMTLTTPGCPLGGLIADAARDVLRRLPGVQKVRIFIVWDPPWDPSMMTPAGRAMLGLR